MASGALSGPLGGPERAVGELGAIILKIEPESDLYAVWSTNVDSFFCWGTKKEVFDYLVETSEKKPEFAVPETEARFERVERTGSSSFTRTGRWDDSGFVFEQAGWLRRDQIRNFLESYNKETEEFDLSLLEPLDD